MAAPPGEIGSPLQLLQGDFASTDQEIRLRAIKRARLVAEVMGAEAARDELVPYLTSIVDDDDEVLLAIAEQLGGFVPLVGGAAHASLLLPCLENLASVDETVVREMAVTATCDVLKASQASCAEASAAMYPVGPSVSPQGVAGELRGGVGGKRSTGVERTASYFKVQPHRLTTAIAPCCRCAHSQVKRLVAGDWFTSRVKRLVAGDWFTSRVSACGLFAATYKANIGLTDARAALRAQFEAMSKDDTPMVRRAAAAHLGDFAGVLELDALCGELVPALTSLIGDEQDSVRLLAAEQLIGGGGQDSVRLLAARQSAFMTAAMVTGGRANEAATLVVPLFKKAAEDRSWRVRHSVAKSYPTMAKSLGSAVFTRELVAPLNALLQDIEMEVRAQALKGSDMYVELMTPDTFAVQVMPSVSALVQDVSLGVRAALSDACMALAPRLGQDHTVRSVLPMLQHFLRDESSEVRLHILTKLEALADMMPAIADQLLPLVLELGHDNIWRVRKAVMLSIPMLAEKLGVHYFEDHLLDMYLQAYQDSVSDVRAGASLGLQQLCRVCGSEWVSERLIPKLLELYQASTFYLHRITILCALKTLLGDGTSASQALVAEVVQMMLTGARDPIPNVRFTAARALQDVAPCLEDAALQAQVKPCLTEMAEADVDSDVKYFATQALLTIK
ncbi:protein phosphatase 2A regulatory subunit [Tribonema minus]|uniref:Protein phosphatase 2A regulatory subunit n=1 Tax=Tribonema minus TaxID=303371 RepID=A0A836CRQ9_9STRA|nr:protein phosphatase 2A regulatory subunit [Tribonema minus]